MSSHPNDEITWPEIVRRDAGKIRFGSVTVTIHEGRVTQVETAVRTRFASAAAPFQKTRGEMRKPAGGSVPRPFLPTGLPEAALPNPPAPQNDF